MTSPRGFTSIQAHLRLHMSQLSKMSTKLIKRQASRQASFSTSRSRCDRLSHIRLSSATSLYPELAADKVTHNPHDPKNQPCFQTASPRDPVPPFPPMHARIAPDRNSASTLLRPATRRRGRMSEWSADLDGCAQTLRNRRDVVVRHPRGTLTHPPSCPVIAVQEQRIGAAAAAAAAAADVTRCSASRQAAYRRAAA